MNENNTSETVNELPYGQFRGNITIVEDASEAAKIVDILKKADVIGFDTETKPAFKKGEKHKIALLQLSTLNDAYLFRLNKTGFLPELIELFENDSILKIGVGIRDDLRGLNKLRRFKPGGFIELQDMAKSLQLGTFSLKGLAAEILNLHISKRQRLSNWEADILTQAQIDYAATDAWVALCIFNELMLKEPTCKVESVNYV